MFWAQSLLARQRRWRDSFFFEKSSVMHGIFGNSLGIFGKSPKSSLCIVGMILFYCMVAHDRYEISLLVVRNISPL